MKTTRINQAASQPTRVSRRPGQTTKKVKPRWGKTWTWSVSGYMLDRRSHEEIREICLGAGLAGIEGAPPLFEGRSDLQLKAIGAQYRAAGLDIPTFHLPFAAEDDLSSFYETARKKAVDHVRHWMERSLCLGATIGIQHASTSRHGVDADGLDTYLRQLGKSLGVLLPLADSLSYTLAIENLPPAGEGDRFMGRPEHFERVQKEFAHPRLGFCLDTGHALMSRREHADAFIDAMSSRLVAFHLADNAGDRDSHLAPGRGLVDWKKIFRRAAEVGYPGCMCIETPPFAPGPDYAIEAWRQMVLDADALVAQALE
ncbi:MAG: sugar phosphate isomerase/epimerase [Planctomycetes bacterium]|nr:sugar phosphate isomerase/epimerase [Planctomycetota bacterium]